MSASIEKVWTGETKKFRKFCLMARNVGFKTKILCQKGVFFEKFSKYLKIDISNFSPNYTSVTSPILLVFLAKFNSIQIKFKYIMTPNRSIISNLVLTIILTSNWSLQ